jgi:hypothetical protein
MYDYNISSKGKMVVGIVLIIVIMTTAAFVGCMSEDKESKNGNSEEPEDQPNIEGIPDNGDKNESDPSEIEELEGMIVSEGMVEALAQADPETVSETVEINIPDDNITAMDFVIKVEDGDEETNADEVSGSLDSDGGYTNILQYGLTPYSTTINITPSEGQFLPATWNATFEVVCHASDDQSPNPFIWSGEPDHGFSYKIIVKFKYIQ